MLLWFLYPTKSLYDIRGRLLTSSSSTALVFLTQSLLGIRGRLFHIKELNTIHPKSLYTVALNHQWKIASSNSLYAQSLLLTLTSHYTSTSYSPIPPRKVFSASVADCSFLEARIVPLIRKVPVLHTKPVWHPWQIAHIQQLNSPRIPHAKPYWHPWQIASQIEAQKD